MPLSETLGCDSLPDWKVAPCPSTQRLNSQLFAHVIIGTCSPRLQTVDLARTLSALLEFQAINCGRDIVFRPAWERWYGWSLDDQVKIVGVAEFPIFPEERGGIRYHVTARIKIASATLSQNGSLIDLDSSGSDRK